MLFESNICKILRVLYSIHIQQFLEILLERGVVFIDSSGIILIHN